MAGPDRLGSATRRAAARLRRRQRRARGERCLRRRGSRALALAAAEDIDPRAGAWRGRRRAFGRGTAAHRAGPGVPAGGAGRRPAAARRAHRPPGRPDPRPRARGPAPGRRRAAACCWSCTTARLAAAADRIVRVPHPRLHDQRAARRPARAGASGGGGAVTRPAAWHGAPPAPFAAPDRPRFAAAVAWACWPSSASSLLMAASAWLISRGVPAAAAAGPLAGHRGGARVRARSRRVPLPGAAGLARRRVPAARRLRVRFYPHLEPLAPAGLAEFRRGDLLARMVDDVDAVQDLSCASCSPPPWPRPPRPPPWPGRVAAPVRRAVLLVALLVAALAVPAVTAWAGRRAETRLAGARRADCEVVALLRACPTWSRSAPRPRTSTGSTPATPSSPGSPAAPPPPPGSAPGWPRCAPAGGLGLPGRRGARRPRRQARRHRAGRRRAGPARRVRGRPAAADRAARAGPHPQQRRTGARRPRPAPHRCRSLPSPCAAARPGPRALRLRGRQRAVARHRRRTPRPRSPASTSTSHPGRRVAVVGASGAGKSTLAAVLLRFADLTAAATARRPRRARPGRRRRPPRRRALRPGRARVRLHRPGEPPAGPARLRRRRAARTRCAGPGCSTGSTACPTAWTPTSASAAVRMSAGERQRLALARALLADFPVLVLDEPTANLDPPTAAALTDDLLAATDGRSVLLITHRLDGLDQVDEILVLEAGPSSNAARTPSCCRPKAGSTRSGQPRPGRRTGPIRPSDSRSCREPPRSAVKLRRGMRREPVDPARPPAARDAVGGVTSGQRRPGARWRWRATSSCACSSPTG